MKALKLLLYSCSFIFNLHAYAQAGQLDCQEKRAVPGGYLCAIKPSLTHPSIADNSFEGSGTHRIFGFGYHVVGVPNSVNHKSPVYVHFGGSFGKPYMPFMGRFASERVLSEGMQNGYLMIQLAYDNKYSVNHDQCRSHLDLDDCAGNIRLEKQTGQDVSPLANTNVSNSINFRFEKMMDYLKGKGLVGNTQASGWNEVSVSGHSQGGGQALFIAMNYGVKRACLYAGGYDLGDSVGNNDGIPMADWIKRPSKTPMERIRAIVHTAEQSYRAFHGAFKYLGLYQLGNVFEVSHQGENFSNPHGAVISAPELVSIRKEACF